MNRYYAYQLVCIYCDSICEMISYKELNRSDYTAEICLGKDIRC